MATAISALALLISIFTLYLTYFRKSASLIGRVASVQVAEKGQIDPWEFDFSLSNAGNLELLVKGVMLELDVDDGRLVPEVSSELPRVLRPGQIQLIRVSIPSRFIENVAESGRGLNVVFEVFSSKGDSYLPAKVIFGPGSEAGEFKRDLWKSFPLGDAV